MYFLKILYTRSTKGRCRSMDAVCSQCFLPMNATLLLPGIIHKSQLIKGSPMLLQYGSLFFLPPQKSARKLPTNNLYNSLLLHWSIHHRVLRATAGSARSYRSLVVVAVIVVVFVNFNFSRCWLRMFLALFLLPLEHGMHRWHLMRQSLWMVRGFRGVIVIVGAPFVLSAGL